MNQPQPATTPESTVNLVDEDAQNRQADRIAEQVFGGEENAEKTGGLITRFVASYEHHKQDQPLDAWLTAEFRQYPIW